MRPLSSRSIGIALLCTFLSMTACCEGGHCWSFVDKNGRCTEILKTHVLKEDCCSDGSATTAWSEEDLRSGDLFFWRMFGGGVRCQPCKDSCEGVECGKDMKCIIKNRKPKCVCAPKCTKRKWEIGEVCGTDGRSYRHVCRLLKRQCRKDKQLAVAYFGRCQKTCENVRCPGKKSCLLDQNLRPHCVRCKQHCPPVTAGRYLCGADNVTYPSYCHIRQAACVRGRAIQESYKGKCQADATCETVKCRRGKRCLLDPDTKLPRCITCPDRCHWPKKDPVCASNNFTYSSWCHMMQDSCKLGVLLRTQSDGSCEEPTNLRELNAIPLATYEGTVQS
ncbi:follistatin-like [Centruroides sculpturatus]|uniref:follistatin-like n=1 Tax=Centruroides sculpturatus TaxID=218467 RepID=UPI000C6F01E3|nr:follistatin-like [Centruroides sculpturatus]